MSNVGAFPGVNGHRRMVKGPDNPLDRSSIFSIYGKDINEVKPTIQPGRFFIPAGSVEKPSRLVVGTSSWWREIDEEQPLLEIPHSSIQVATSIVNDYCNGLLAADPNNARPGIFFIPGTISVAELREPKYNHILGRAIEKQDNWYKALLKMADTLWARTNGNPLCITDDMRIAAQALNLTGKDWMQDFQMMETVKCIACGMPRNPKFPICPNCHMIVDSDLANTLGIKEAPRAATQEVKVNPLKG